MGQNGGNILIVFIHKDSQQYKTRPPGVCVCVCVGGGGGVGVGGLNITYHLCPNFGD